MRKKRLSGPSGTGMALADAVRPGACLSDLLRMRCVKAAAGAGVVVLMWMLCLARGTAQVPSQSLTGKESLPPRVAQAQRFLAQRGLKPGQRIPRRLLGQTGAHPSAQSGGISAQGGSGSSATWLKLGPSAVQTSSFGLVSGRVSSVAIDPSDATGNHVYVGTTGGGVWAAQNANAATASSVVFTPLTDTPPVLGGAVDASISIGAVSVQPGGTGVILAGTGDPNDELDSYYGAGILRSADGGSTWSLIAGTADVEAGLGVQDYSFTGEGFAGFAWSTVNPQRVVAAVSQAYEGTLVDAERPGASYEGLYYSSDSGVTWHLATITDSSGNDVQGPLDRFATPYGNAATAVVWNPVRKLFVAAVRYHGYYQSADGVTWTRMTAQPGTGLTTLFCPTNAGSTGSINCPIFRGALAVNPQTGDTFAWSVDGNNQDQGLWQDSCLLSGSACTNLTVTFARQWNTAKLETNTSQGLATIADGNYNLTLAAVPSQQDTLVFAGGNDLWLCSIAMGCVWRNTTNSTTCMSAGVGEFQHALAWNPSNELEMFVGNDSGLWRSTDAVAESGSVCSATDSTHFQNLNGNLGSLAEVESLSAVPVSPYTMMAGLGVNGTAGVKSNAAKTDWPQILGGYGGPVAIDPNNNSNWYVNDQSGVAIYRCTQATACTPSDFGTSPVVNDADVGGDGNLMTTPAPFLVDPLDSTQLLIGTCRVWRGPANGSGWTASDAISPIFDTGATSGKCSGDALIRSMTAMALTGSSEVVYLGTYGSANNGANLPGHLLKATIQSSASGSPVWSDLTLNPVANDSESLNAYGLDISSVYVDTLDLTGNTVYVTVEGMQEPTVDVREVYRSTDGGASWNNITANLPSAPANSIAVDPQNPNTVYVATDQGVYFTTEVGACAVSLSNCWTAFGTGLPTAPVTALSATPVKASAQVLVAGTYGRGVWQTQLWSAEVGVAAATATPASLAFASQVFGSASAGQTVTLTNTGSVALGVTAISMSGDFAETDNCVNQSVAGGASCSIQVTFTPLATGPRSGQMTIYANVYGGQLTVDLGGTGAPTGVIGVSPGALDLGSAQIGLPSAIYSVGVTNSGSVAVPLLSVSISQPFAIASNTCGATSLAANFTCQIRVNFVPTQAGAVTGLLILTDGAGTQTVQLTGNGQSAATDVLNPTALTLPTTPVGQVSSAMPVTLTNLGDLTLTSISYSVTGMFQASTNCGTQLATKSVCTFSVQFVPTQPGSQTGTLSITDVLRTQTVALSGTGQQAGVLSVSPASLSFPLGQAGVASAPQTVTITNTGGAPIANIGFQFTGAAAGSYSAGTTNCGTVLNSGSSCTVQIIFTPAGTGSIAGTLAISSSSAGVTAASVQLNGSGQLTAGLTTNTSLVTFATAVGVGQTSTAQSVQITNTSQYTIASVSLAATAPFSLTQNTCTGSLAAGSSCTTGVVLQPTVFGPATGTLTVSSSSVATPATVTLAGTGYDFTVTISGLSSATVPSGQQADYSLVLAAEGASGAVTVACGTLPTNALCLFNPTTETIVPGVQGNVMVQIYTGQTGLALRAEPLGGGRAAPLLCGLLLLPLALIRRRKVLLLLLLAAVLAGGVSSCTSSGGGTGGSSSQKGGSSTPAGTYLIPVTATSAGVSHGVTVSLTVD